MSQDPVWSAFAASYDELVPRLGCFRRMVDKAVGHVAGRATVVDAGCGTGLLLEPLLGVAERVVGFDPDPTMRGRAVARRDRLPAAAAGRVTVVDGRAERFPDAVTEPVDAILLLNVLFNVADPDVVLAECARQLRPGGRLVLTGPRQPPDLAAVIERSIAEWQAAGTYDEAHRAAIDQHLAAARRIVVEPGHMRHFFEPDALVERLRGHGLERVVAADGEDYFGQNFHVCVER